MQRMLAASLVAVMAATACNGGTPVEDAGTTAAPDAACSPSGTELEVSSAAPGEPNAFSEECLAAPAGEEFTIRFENPDDEQHNIAIFEGTDATGENLFRGDIFEGGDTKTHRVDPLEAGIYFFHCDVHPEEMTGQFVVE